MCGVLGCDSWSSAHRRGRRRGVEHGGRARSGCDGGERRRDCVRGRRNSAPLGPSAAHVGPARPGSPHSERRVARLLAGDQPVHNSPWAAPNVPPHQSILLDHSVTPAGPGRPGGPAERGNLPAAQPVRGPPDSGSCTLLTGPARWLPRAGKGPDISDPARKSGRRAGGAAAAHSR